MLLIITCKKLPFFDYSQTRLKTLVMEECDLIIVSSLPVTILQNQVLLFVHCMHTYGTNVPLSLSLFSSIPWTQIRFGQLRNVIWVVK